MISFTQQTGQGMPMFVVYRAGLTDEINDLVEKGKVQIIDDFVCLTGIYCVEAEEAKIGGLKMNSPLHFIRRWLGLDQSGDVMFCLWEGKTGKEVHDEWLASSEEDYQQWLIENKEGLDAITNFQPVTESELFPERSVSSNDVSVSPELFEFITTREWYTDNESVSLCLQQSDEQKSLVDALIKAHKQLISLYDTKGNLSNIEQSEYQESVSKIEGYELELSYRTEISKMLSGGSSQLIQDFLKLEINK
jgi:hypothetical protein